MEAEREIHSHYPVPVTSSEDEEETQYEKGEDDGNHDPVSQFLLCVTDRQQCYHVSAHEVQQYRRQENRYQRDPECTCLIGSSSELFDRIHSVHVSYQHSETDLQTERYEHQEEIHGEGIASSHMEQNAETGYG